MLFLAMLPACTAIAQSGHVHEDLNRVPVVSALSREIKETETVLVQPDQKFLNTPVQFSSAEEQKKLKASLDYFPALDALHKTINHPGVPHDISSTYISNTSVNLEGTVYEGVACYVIKDRYKIKAGKELPGDFVYNNTYFLYQNQKGEELATLIYVESKIGNIRSEYKIAKKGVAAMVHNTFTLSPNPAQKDITIACNLATAGQYTLRISNIEGKTMMTVLDKKELAAGSFTAPVTLNLAAGVYVVTLSAGDATPVTQKLIIK